MRLSGTSTIAPVHCRLFSCQSQRSLQPRAEAKGFIYRKAARHGVGDEYDGGLALQLVDGPRELLAGPGVEVARRRAEWAANSCFHFLFSFSYCSVGFLD